MPRCGRIDFPGALHHVIIRGINRAAIFRDNNDRENFVRRLQKGLVETKLRCYAWVLMLNHVHLLLRTGPQPLTKLMRCLLTGHAIYFNLRHNRAGYLFQNRYKSILCDDEAYLLQLVRYIHLNPLRANIISSLQELNTYPWCGHSVLLGNEKAEWQDTGEIPMLKDARSIAPAAHAALRYCAVKAVLDGMIQIEAAEVFGITRQAVGKWIIPYGVPGIPSVRSDET